MGRHGRRIDITPSEMMELRNQGYSNKDIANMLDISHETVRKYIGNQGCRMGGLAAFKDKPKKKEVQAPAEAVTPPYVPKVMVEEYLIGDAVVEKAIFAKINHDSEKLTLEAVSGTITLTYEQLRELVQFLVWASDKCKPHNEVGDSL